MKQSSKENSDPIELNTVPFLTLNLSGWYSILTSIGIFIKNWILFNNSVCKCGSAYYMGLGHGDMLVYFSVIKIVSNSKYLPKTTKYMKKLF